MRETIRRKHYSIRTEEAYVDWIKRYILFHNKRHPSEMSSEEIERFLNHLATQKNVAASTQNQAFSALVFLYREVLKIDFDYRQITVRDGKGAKDRVTMLPESTHEVLNRHLEKVRLIHQRDLRNGYGETYLPYALERKYKNASREWAWQYVFPAGRISRDPRSGRFRRHHVDEKSLQRAVKNAVRAVRINKTATCHTFRHSFATHLLQNGHDIHPVR